MDKKLLNDVLKKHNHSDIPYISVQELAMPKPKLNFGRKKFKEYKVSHLKDAVFVDFENST